MKDQAHVTADAQDEIDLIAFFAALWRSKIFIIGVTALFAIASVLYAISLPNIYRSQVLLAPTNSQAKAGGALGQLGGLASLAGINLGANATDKTALALEVVRSRDFITQLIERHELLVPLMAAKGWDWRTNTLQYDSDLYDVNAAAWVREVEAPKSPQPSLQEAYEEFIKRLTVSQSKDTGMVTFFFEHYSPEIAKSWLLLITSELNSIMKQRDIADAKLSMAYLEQQLQQTQIEELRRALFQLIEEQTKTLMLASVSQEYVLRTIDPPVAPEKKAKPSRALICIAGTLLGGFLACFIVLIRFLIKPATPRRQAE